MPSLPTPGGDIGTWGTEMNEYLTVAHKADGNPKNTAKIFNLMIDYGAVGDGTTDDTAAITAWLAAAGAVGGLAYAPPGTYKTNGGHTVPPGVQVFGARPYTTTFYNRGATYCFLLMDVTSPSIGPSLSHLSIEGSTASLSPVSGGIGVEIANGIRSHMNNVQIYGFTDNGIGIYFHIRAGEALDYTEHTLLVGCGVVNCKRLIQFKCDHATGGSFGYTQWVNQQLQIYADQIGIDVGGTGGTGTDSVLYNCNLQGQFHYTGNNGVAIDVTSKGVVWQGATIDFIGEKLAAYTGCIRIRNVKDFRASGRFQVVNGQPPDSASTATSHRFHEIKLASNHAPYLAEIRSSAVWDIPATTNGTAIQLEMTGITGANMGDPVSVGLSTGLSAGVVLTAQVSGADTVQVLLLNNAGWTIDPASATVYVIVHKA